MKIKKSTLIKLIREERSKILNEAFSSSILNKLEQYNKNAIGKYGAVRKSLVQLIRQFSKADSRFKDIKWDLVQDSHIEKIRVDDARRKTYDDYLLFWVSLTEKEYMDDSYSKSYPSKVTIEPKTLIGVTCGKSMIEQGWSRSKESLKPGYMRKYSFANSLRLKNVSDIVYGIDLSNLPAEISGANQQSTDRRTARAGVIPVMPKAQRGTSNDKYAPTFKKQRVGVEAIANANRTRYKELLASKFAAEKEIGVEVKRVLDTANKALFAVIDNAESQWDLGQADRNISSWADNKLDMIRRLSSDVLEAYAKFIRYNKEWEEAKVKYADKAAAEGETVAEYLGDYYVRNIKDSVSNLRQEISRLESACK